MVHRLAIDAFVTMHRARSRDRHGPPHELFALWFGANFGILGVVYGGLLTAFGVNLWQALLIAVVAAIASYGLVALVSLAGPRYGVPTTAFSRRVFGRTGNAGCR